MINLSYHQRHFIESEYENKRHSSVNPQNKNRDKNKMLQANRLGNWPERYYCTMLWLWLLPLCKRHSWHYCTYTNNLVSGWSFGDQ